MNFGLIGSKSRKKCAKSTILNIKVKIKKSKCQQKIPCTRFDGDDISSYGLIFNTNSAREHNEIFIEKPYFFLESFLFCCVENETIVAYIVPSKPHPRNISVAF
jgi:hypothetical protein